MKHKPNSRGKERKFSKQKLIPMTEEMYNDIKYFADEGSLTGAELVRIAVTNYISMLKY